jgi:hypothetical protein
VSLVAKHLPSALSILSTWTTPLIKIRGRYLGSLVRLVGLVSGEYTEYTEYTKYLGIR